MAHATNGGTGPTPGDARERPIGELVKDLSQQTSTLVRKEIELARAELQQKGKIAGKGVGLLVGAGVALLASLVFINLGILLPGMLTSLGGPQPDQRGAYLEFGPAAAPIISEPAPPRESQRQTLPNSQPAARPHIWRHLLGGMALHTAPQDAVE